MLLHGLYAAWSGCRYKHIDVKQVTISFGRMEIIVRGQKLIPGGGEMSLSAQARW